MNAAALADLRSTVEGALLSTDCSRTDCEIARRLGVSGHCVGRYRRRLERSGDISAVDYRLTRRGKFIDVRRIGKDRAGSAQRLVFARVP
jgi:5-enolpyruvylshikimate-3-phosphate synthase